MTTERDTHFAGFAESHYLELSDLFAQMYACQITGEHSGADQARYAIKDLIAQRAYDLVYNSLEFTRTSPDPRTMQLSSTEVWMRFMPDLTEWPTPPHP